MWNRWNIVFTIPARSLTLYSGLSCSKMWLRHDVLGFSNWLGIPSCVIGDVPVIGVHLGTSWGCWCVFLCVSLLLIVIRSGTCGWSSRTLNISCFPGWEHNYLCQRFINNSRFQLYCGSHPPWAVCNWWVLTLRLCNEK